MTVVLYFGKLDGRKPEPVTFYNNHLPPFNRLDIMLSTKAISAI